jgi:hypothetical protein
MGRVHQCALAAVLGVLVAGVLIAGSPTSHASPAVAPVARLMTDESGRWAHQDSRTYNVYLAVASPRLRYWLTRAVGAWNLRTALVLRVVSDPRLANVLVVAHHAGPQTSAAWTDVCGPCGLTVSHFNLDRLSTRPSPTQYPFADPVLWMLSCHEVGHVIGLAHGGGDCLTYGYGRVTTWGIGARNVALVNSAFRGAPYAPPAMPGVGPGTGATVTVAAHPELAGQ